MMKLMRIFTRYASFLSALLMSFSFTNKDTIEVATSKNIYDYSFTTIEGKKVKLSDYKGKKLLIVNTASFCGYTPQYEALEKIAEMYKDKLVVLGFPANDFGFQEPESNKKIKEFCTKNYHVSFTLSEKVKVKGDSMTPIYQWLTKKELNGKMDSHVKWNFQKYLIDENGNYVQMFGSKITPDSKEITDLIEK